MNIDRNPRFRAALRRYGVALRRHRVFYVAVAFALLVLVVGAPVWASSLPGEMQQGTVPVPPSPGDGGTGGGSGGNSGGSSSGDRDDTQNQGAGLPEATATSAAPGQAGAAVESTPAALAGTLTGVVGAPRLNVRGGPGVSFPTIGTVLQGQTLHIISRDATGSWWYVCCIPGSTKNGWVNATFVTPNFDANQALALVPLATNTPVAAAAPLSTPAAPAVVPTNGLTGTVAVARLNLRSGPGVDHAIVGKLLLGDALKVTARSEGGDWWYVCCLAGTQTPGWVSAEFVQPAFVREQANALLSVYGEQVRVILPTPTPKAPKIAAAASAPVAAGSPATTTLALRVHLEPVFAVPGSTLQLAYVISNTGPITATAIELRNEVAAPFALAESRSKTASAFQVQGYAGGNSLVTVQWPTLAPGDAVTATLQLTMSTAVTPGIVVDNLAAVAASNARSTTAGVSIGLPPAALPDFQ